MPASTVPIQFMYPPLPTAPQRSRQSTLTRMVDYSFKLEDYEGGKSFITGAVNVIEKLELIFIGFCMYWIWDCTLTIREARRELTKTSWDWNGNRISRVEQLYIPLFGFIKNDVTAELKVDIVAFLYFSFVTGLFIYLIVQWLRLIKGFRCNCIVSLDRWNRSRRCFTLFCIWLCGIFGFLDWYRIWIPILASIYLTITAIIVSLYNYGVRGFRCQCENEWMCILRDRK